MRTITGLAALFATVFAASASFAACDGVRRQGEGKPRAGCPEPKRFEPYLPDRARAADRRGFVDVGGGTEVRIGGRTRFEYQYTR